MTTAEELWNDAEFVEKRLREQIDILQRYSNKRFYSEDRRKEVVSSVLVILNRFYYRLMTLDPAKFATYQMFFHSSYGKSAKNFFLPSTSPGVEINPPAEKQV